MNKRVVSFKRTTSEGTTKGQLSKAEVETSGIAESNAEGTTSASRRRASKLRRPPPKSYLTAQGKVCPTCGNCNGHPTTANSSGERPSESYTQPIPRRVVFPPVVRMSRRMTRYSGFDPRSSTYGFIHSTIDFADPTLPDLNFLDGLVVPPFEDMAKENERPTHTRSSSVPIFKRAFSSPKGTFLIFGSREPGLGLPRKSRKRVTGREEDEQGATVAEVQKDVAGDSGHSEDEPNRAVPENQPADDVEAALMFLSLIHI